MYNQLTGPRERSSEEPTKQTNLWLDAIRRFRRNKLAMFGALIVFLLVFAAIFAPWITLAGYDETKYLEEAYAFPSMKHLLGIDPIGRDYFSRIVYGARVSLMVGFLATGISSLVGIPLGALAGYLGGKADWFIMRLIEIISVIPPLLIAILFMTILGSGLQNVVLAIVITGWINVCRLVRGQILSLKERDFVIAARGLGAKSHRIIIQHLLPNSLGPIIVSMTLGIPTAIMIEAGLSFLGLGVNPPTPSWGQMINDGLSYMRFYWHLPLFPAIMVALTMLAFSFVGDGLRDALDPMMKI